jgi:hypothetical protein
MKMRQLGLLMACLVLAVGLGSAGMYSSGIATLDDTQLAATSAAGNCYNCESESCDGLGPFIPNCIQAGLSCAGGCDSYCRNYNSKSWCEFMDDEAYNCLLAVCTQSCPPGDQYDNTSDPEHDCYVVLGACPSCSYIRIGSC